MFVDIKSFVNKIKALLNLNNYLGFGCLFISLIWWRERERKPQGLFSLYIRYRTICEYSYRLLLCGL